MGYFTRNEQIIVIVIVLVVAAISVFGFLNKRGMIGSRSDLEDPFSELNLELIEGDEDIQGDGQEFDSSNSIENEIIMVHLCGAVNNPGIIELKVGARVIDGINLAGGLKNTADSDRINLARKLFDEEKLYIPKIGEIDLPIEVSGLNEENKDNSSKENKVNINTASKEELMTLVGIGEVTAEKILDYRENQLFKTLDDIKNVSGIGDKKYESIKENITVK